MLLQRLGEQRKRQDYRAGVIAALIANVYRDPKKHPQPFGPADFFPSLAEVKKPQTPEDHLVIVTMLNVAFGGRDLRSATRPAP